MIVLSEKLLRAVNKLFRCERTFANTVGGSGLSQPDMMWSVMFEKLIRLMRGFNSVAFGKDFLNP